MPTNNHLFHMDKDNQEPFYNQWKRWVLLNYLPTFLYMFNAI